MKKLPIDIILCGNSRIHYFNGKPYKMKKKNYKPKNQKIRLDIGCGFNCQSGFIGMDKRAVKGVDIVHDVEAFPWPLDNNSCCIILMSHLVEHVKPWLTIDLINECWRILEPDGLLMISTPYAGSFGYYQDPTHCNPWNEATPTYFFPDQPLYQVYKPKPWKPDRVAWSLNGNLEIAMRKINEKTE